MRGAASPWRHIPPAPKKWPIAVAGEVVDDVEAVSPAEAASAWFRSESAEDRFPLRCSVGPYVFRNSNKPRPREEEPTHAEVIQDAAIGESLKP